MLGIDSAVCPSKCNGRSATLKGIDAITDFTDSVDRIDVSGIDADSRLSGDQAFTFLGGALFDGQRGVLRYDTGVAGETHVLLDMNGDKIADFDLVLVGTHFLSNSDFLL